ncbi:MAG: hypothetical protein JXA96_16950 [Sedimentisphaerales bacterium]|nr:hypothetical protein [Sedimentisphaerales bacterium]
MKNNIKRLLLNISFSILFFSPILAANEQINTDSEDTLIPQGLESIWDSAKYISLDEIKPGMEAYCLTEYSIAGIEKFALDVIDVVRDLEVGKNVILVKGTDERFIKTGPVAGCSGSPVYIEGRLAGALAFTWSYSKEPLYAATPIEDMLGIDQNEQSPTSKTVALDYDFTIPVNFTRVNNSYNKSLTKLTQTSSGLNPLPCPLIASGISTKIPEQFKSITESLGLMVVSGGGISNTNDEENSNIKLVPGASLGVPLVSGDIKLSTMGTVTEVIGNKVYGFGHMLLGFGNVNLPMATGKVHTIVSNLSSSFKMASILDIVGTLKSDESTGVIGQIGEIPKTIPLTIEVDHCNDSKIRTYNCRIASNALITPAYLEMALSGAATKSSDLPTEHMIEYQFDIGIENGEVISCKNISTDSELNEVVGECVAVVTLIMDNPFKKIDIESINLKLNIKPKNISSNIWSVDLSKSEVKAGETIDISVIVESYLGGKKKYSQSIKIPKDLKPDTYDLSISGSRGYEEFITKAAPQKFVAQSIPDLIEAINNLLEIKRNKLFFILVLPTGGITLEKAELPDLPATKAIILQDKKRGLNIRPYQHWIEKRIDIDSVITNQKVMKITVVE